jgi:hypothetical protein
MNGLRARRPTRFGRDVVETPTETCCRRCGDRTLDYGGVGEQDATGGLVEHVPRHLRTEDCASQIHENQYTVARVGALYCVHHQRCIRPNRVGIVGKTSRGYDRNI